MLTLQMRRTNEISADAISAMPAILEALASEWPPLVDRARQLQAESLGLTKEELQWGVSSQVRSFGDEQDVAAGEIFVVPDGVVILSLRNEDSGQRLRFREGPDGSIVPIFAGKANFRLTVSALTHGNPDDYFKRIQGVLDEPLSALLEEFRYKNDRFEDLRSEVVSEDLPGSEDVRRGARALLDRRARSLAVAIKSSRGLLVGDADRHVPEGTDPVSVLTDLVNSGLATMEVVVVCTSSGQQVARVPDKRSLSKLAREGLRCACGKPIDQESPSDLYSITDTGVLLLDKSRWMSVLVRERLEALGVPSKDILLECQLGSDEIDCLALVSGEVALFELKDKDFSVGNAYSFGAKISVVRPRHAVIVTTETVSMQVKDHFSRTSAVEPGRLRTGRDPETQPVKYIEGADFLDGIDPIVGNIYADDARQLLDGVLTLAVARGKSLIDALQTQPLTLKSTPAEPPTRTRTRMGAPEARS